MAEKQNRRGREIWKAVPGYRAYEVSNLGRVRSRDREIVQISPWGKLVRRFLRGVVLKPGRHPDGHLLVNLSKRNVAKTRSVHKLVLLAFVGKPPSGKQACHYDGKPKNNGLTNLRYDTPKGNDADKLRHGTRVRGERHGAARLTKKQVLKIRTSKLMGVTLAQIYGVSKTQVSNVRNRKAWSWL